MTAETNSTTAPVEPEGFEPVEPVEFETTPTEPALRTDTIVLPAHTGAPEKAKLKVGRKPKKPVAPDFARPVGPAPIWILIGFLAYPVFGVRAALLVIAFAAAALVYSLTVFIWDTGIYCRKYRRYERRLAKWKKRNRRDEV